jgi:tetratricopeptide (TPR) repeat protein
VNDEVQFYDRAASCRELEEPLREAIDARILSIEATHVSAVARQSKRLEARGRTDEASALLEAALAVHPGSGRLWALLAKTRLASERPETALDVLDRAAQHGIEGAELLVAKARVFAALEDRESMIAALTKLRGLAKGDARKLASARLLEGDLEALTDNVERALGAYRVADQADPSSPALYKAAALAARTGRRRQAYQAYRELCGRDSRSIACKLGDDIGRQLGIEPASE